MHETRSGSQISQHPDVILVIGEGGDIVQALRDDPALVHLRDPDANEIMTRVETLLQVLCDQVLNQDRR
jgi:hypothetical protein